MVPAGNPYVGIEGQTYHMLPLKNGKSAGLLVACTASKQAVSPDIFTQCVQTASGGSECRLTKEGSISFSVGHNLFCLFYVDKITLGGSRAVQADWFKEETFFSSGNLTVQVLPLGKKAPVAEFECKAIDCNPSGQKTKCLECDASKSHDPDGKIAKYYWKTLEFGSRESQQPAFQKPIWFSLKKTSITLAVYDNDGFYSEKTKTIDLEEKPAIVFEASYSNSTKKVSLTLKNCPEGATQADIDIDLLDAGGKPGLSVLEKQPIDCERPIEVGPITARGFYQATAKIAGIEKPAWFSVPSP